jgi:hypothetical protein
VVGQEAMAALICGEKVSFDLSPFSLSIRGFALQGEREAREGRESESERGESESASARERER